MLSVYQCERGRKTGRRGPYIWVLEMPGWVVLVSAERRALIASGPALALETLADPAVGVLPGLVSFLALCGWAMSWNQTRWHWAAAE